MNVPWTELATLAAAASAVFAGAQLHFSRSDARRVAVLNHLREVELRLQPLLAAHASEVRRHVIAAYRGEVTLSDTGRAYISFLTALDLLAFARCAGTVDGKLADVYVGTLLRSHMITLTFITELQQCCDDAAIYEHLKEYLVTTRNKRLKEAIANA